MVSRVETIRDDYAGRFRDHRAGLRRSPAGSAGPSARTAPTARRSWRCWRSTPRCRAIAGGDDDGERALNRRAALGRSPAMRERRRPEGRWLRAPLRRKRIEPCWRWVRSRSPRRGCWLALAGLPVIWWLLRVTPPAPRRIAFPAIRLLLGLMPREETPARTPLWLILLRMVLAALVIVGAAHPLLNPQAQLAGTGPVDPGRRRRLGGGARLAGAPGRARRPAGRGRARGPPDRPRHRPRPRAATRRRRRWHRSAPRRAAPRSTRCSRSRGRSIAGAALGAPRKRSPCRARRAAIWLSDGIDDGGGRQGARGLSRPTAAALLSDRRSGLRRRCCSPPATARPRI